MLIEIQRIEYYISILTVKNNQDSRIDIPNGKTGINPYTWERTIWNFRGCQWGFLFEVALLWKRLYGKIKNTYLTDFDVYLHFARFSRYIPIQYNRNFERLIYKR